VTGLKERISCSVKILYPVLSGLSIAVLVQKVNTHIYNSNSSYIVRCIESNYTCDSN